MVNSVFICVLTMPDKYSIPKTQCLWSWHCEAKRKCLATIPHNLITFLSPKLKWNEIEVKQLGSWPDLAKKQRVHQYFHRCRISDLPCSNQITRWNTPTARARERMRVSKWERERQRERDRDRDRETETDRQKETEGEKASLYTFRSFVLISGKLIFCDNPKRGRRQRNRTGANRTCNRSIPDK